MPYGDWGSLQEALASHDSPGVGKLAFALSPAGRERSAQIYQASARQSLSLAESMHNAREVQRAHNAREALAHEYEKNGDTRAAYAIRAGINPEQMSAYDLGHQKFLSLGEMARSADDPTVPLDQINRRLIVAHGEPVELTKIQDNTAVNPYVSPQNQTFATTALGKAMIAAHGAQATDSYAAAGQHNAEANLARARADEVNGNVKTGKDEGKPLTREETLATFGKPDKYGTLQTSPEDYLPFLAFQQEQAKTDPRFRNAHFASMAWAKRALGPSAALHGLGTDAGDAAVEPELSLPAMAGIKPRVAAAPPPPPAAPTGLAAMAADPASTPDVTYDPQDRGLPNTTDSIPEAQALATTRDAKINAATPPPQAVKYLRAFAHDPKILKAFGDKYGVDPTAYLGQ